ncbi:MAG: DNA primase [Lachnospiraceae bacterium]|nr:DNA primase [Lachnospiraceae bacterium]
MYYSEEIIEEVRTKNDIVDVVGASVRLQKKGSSYFGLCPFHNEKSPSFSVSGQKQMYYCFGCGAGGNVITFVMNYENYTFQEALKYLADRAGVTLPEEDASAQNRQKQSKRALLLQINKEAARYFCHQLRSPRGKPGYEYLSERKLSDETIKHFGLGFADKTPGSLTAYLREKGYSDEMLVEAGLCAYDENRGFHDKFWNRVMFPIMDINHRVIGFGGRVMGDGKPKYLNSPETPIFDKSRNLYGLNYARISRAGNLILCEGYMDVIAMHQAGFTQAVASLGTAFTSGQASLIRRYTEQVLLAYDSDGAGVNAALRAIGILKEAGLSGRVINLEPYKDPDEFIKNLGQEAFQERIDKAEDGFLFEIRILRRDFHVEDPAQKTKFEMEAARRLSQMENEIERENYLAAVAREYFIDPEMLRRMVRSLAAAGGQVKPVERPRSTTGKKASAEDNRKKTQRMLLTWLSDEPQIYSQIQQYIQPEDFTDELYRQVAKLLFEELAQGRCDPAGIISRFENEEEQRQVASIFHTRLQGIDNQQQKEKAFKDILYAVKQNSCEYYASQQGTDINALKQVVAARRALEELSKVHILFT